MTINYNNVVLGRIGDPLAEYDSTSLFPVSGSTNVLYRATDSGRLYQWTGSVYAEIGPDSVNVGSHAAQHSTNGTDPIPNIVYRPTALSASVNNYSHNNADILLIDSSASYNITGLISATDGAIKLLVNKSLYTLVIKNQDTNSSANNRFLVPFGSDYNLLAGYSLTVVYDSDASRWRVLA